MRKTRAWQWLVAGILVAVAMGVSVVRADLPASGGSQTNYYVAAEGIWGAHIFTAGGNFITAEALDVEYLIVGGGGGGGGVYYNATGGGGGAGGIVTGATTLAAASYEIDVGNGGAGGAGNSGTTSGASSSIETIGSATGGGKGGANGSAGTSGGSGGGASAFTSDYDSGGSATAGQGNVGGNADTLGKGRAGGGGGKGGRGAHTSEDCSGGAGFEFSITGTSVIYAEGGDGGILGVSGGAAASANTGSGGGGGYHQVSYTGPGGDGGSGIVVVRYLPDTLVVATGATNVTESAADLKGALNASNDTFTVYAFWSTNNNAGSAAWLVDDDAQSAEIDTYTDVMGQAVSNAVSGLSDGTEYFYTLLVSNATTQAWSPTNATFTTITRPIVASIVDDRDGGPIVPDTLVTYTITFNKSMNSGTISSATFTNAGTSAVTFGAVATVDDTVTVEVTPTTDGTLQLAIKARATVEDTEGVALDTSSAIPDNTTITVSSAVPPVVVNPGVGVIGIETATLLGNITSSNGLLEAVRFYIGTTDGVEDLGAWPAPLEYSGSVVEGENFSLVAGSLVAGTEYFYRVYASNETDGAWSDVASFTTLTEAIWTNDANGTWSDTGNWTNAVSGFGGYPARFDTLTLTGARTVTLDTAATVGRLVFGDVGNTYGWTMTPSAAEVLTLSGDAEIDLVNQSGMIAAEIAGSAGLTKLGAGTLVLGGVNTYTGATAVDAGMLQVDGSLDAGSAVTVASAATLRGSGTIGGDVTLAGGATLTAGSAVTRGTLDIGGTLTLDAGSTVALRINKAGGVLSSDRIDLVDPIGYAGTLTVTHSGDALAAGDSFTLFSAASYGGAFGTVNLPTLAGDLEWDYSGLTADGSITVFSTALTLDGTSGSEQHAGPYSTGGPLSTGQGLNVNLGFFVDYLIVAGGGGGGGAYYGKEGGGGGAGGLLSGTTNLTANSYGVVLGGGGAGGAGSSSGVGADGQPSSAFDGEVEARGGGGGGNNNGGARGGGSGGGGPSGGAVGGAGEAGPPRQGHDGGTGADSHTAAAGGGGGALGAGAAGSAGGSGGTGATSLITGTSLTYAQGGNGGVHPASGTVTGTNAVANTGKGGQGGAASGTSSAAGGNGGSGIVVIRYPGTSVPATGGDITTFTGDGTNGELGVDYWVHSFTNVGAGTFDISTLDLDARLAAEITGEISGVGDLVYGGPGRLTLSGANTYTGDTIITNGTLLVSGSLTGTSGVTVESGAAFGGGGSVGSDVTFEAGSTFVASGTLDISGTLTLGANVTLDYSAGSLVIATYTSLVGTFTDISSIPDGFDLVYGVSEIKLVPKGGSVFRFR